ncbi:MAG: type II toxin-antitoxin system HicA family toxin [Patescibacteria group bacterium]
MPKLFSSDYVIRILERHGFLYISQRGSHIKYRKNIQPILTVIVPANRKEIPHGTFRSILRQSQLNEKDF